MIIRSRSLVSKQVMRFILVAVTAVILGLIGRSLAVSTAADATFAQWLPWLNRTPITLYFGDTSGRYLVPVSRTLTGDEESPRALVEALLNGPAEGSGLKNFMPEGTAVHTIAITENALQLDLSSEFLEANSSLAHEALIQSLASWPGLEEVNISVEGEPLLSSNNQLLFYDTLDMLVAVSTNDDNPRAALSSYLEGPDDANLSGLPPDVKLLTYDFNPTNGLLALNFTYTPSVREFGLEQPEALRRVLVGLIATLTAFPEVKAVTLDFEGHARLGLGQCADLLRAPQVQPEVLNDERLLKRYGGT